MQKTLGGDRLGSGKKTKVDLHGFNRSTHDLSRTWRSTMSAGTLVPCFTEIGLPGDTFDIDIHLDGKTHPTIGPLFGSYKYQIDMFVAPFRLYNALIHNNKLKIGMDMSQAILPVIGLTAIPYVPTEITDVDNYQINPSCVLSYLGIRGVGTNGSIAAVTRDFNGVSYLAYTDIYKNYYANKQEEIGAVIHTGAVALIETVDSIEADGTTIVETGTPNDNALVPGTIITIQWTTTQPLPEQIIIVTEEKGPIPLEQLLISYSNTGTTITGEYDAAQWGNLTAVRWRYATPTELQGSGIRVATFDLTNIDEMRESILSTQSTTTPFEINSLALPPYEWLTENDCENLKYSQEGLLIKTYQSDLLNNWLQTEWIDGTNGISAVTAVSTVGDSFTIDSLVIARKVYDMLNSIAISGGSYDDWLDAVWRTDRYKRCETPMYMGGLIQELAFQEVINNSGTPEQPLGTLAGKGTMVGKEKGGHITIKIDEPSYIIGIVSLTPRLDYSQGNKWDTGLKTFNDLHKPHLDEIGFQDLIMEQGAWWSTVWDDLNNVWVQQSAGKQPAWVNYMTSLNETRGNFAIANNEMFMTLNRRYEWESGTFNIKDLTTYIDPAKFNFIFAETALDSQNFWTQIGFHVTARRVMSAKVMPNL